MTPSAAKRTKSTETFFADRYHRMFLDSARFAFVPHLESRWTEIRAEYESLSVEDFFPWPESDLYDFGWRAFGLMALGHRFEPNCDRCPRTTEALMQVPGVVTAGFSMLAAAARIRPHTGYTASVYRFHLGIKVPPECGLAVGGEARSWKEGEVLAFDDTTEHSAWNCSSTDRVVLLLDVLRPGAEFEVTPSALQALEGYLRNVQRSSGLAD